MEDQRLKKLRLLYYATALAIAFFFILIVARQILIPVSLGFLFATLIYPVSQFFRRFRIPGPLSILISILLFLGIISFALILYFSQVQNLIADFPALKLKALANLEYIRLAIEENLGIESALQHAWLSRQIRNFFDAGGDSFRKTLGATTGTLFIILIVPVLVFYMLIFRERFRRFIVMIAPKSYKGQAEHIMSQISATIQRYISGVFIVILILCVLNSVGLYIVGLKYALLFGITSAFFNFIPYFGNWIGAILPLSFAVLTGDSPRLFFSVLVMYIIIQFLEHNVLTPNITGGYVKINPLVTIIGILVAGLVWGISGMLVVIPVIATMKIIFDNIDPLRPYGHLLGSDEEYHRDIWKFFGRIFRRP